MGTTASSRRYSAEGRLNFTVLQQWRARHTALTIALRNIQRLASSGPITEESMDEIKRISTTALKTDREIPSD